MSYLFLVILIVMISLAVGTFMYNKGYLKTGHGFTLFGKKFGENVALGHLTDHLEEVAEVLEGFESQPAKY